MYEANGFRRNDNRKGTFASAVLAGRAGRPTFAQEKTLTPDRVEQRKGD